MRQKKLSSINIFITLLFSVFFGGFLFVNSASADVSARGCVTNTMKSGEFCNWSEGKSWCAGNTLTCAVESTTPCPANPVGGTYSFSCNSNSCVLSCTPTTYTLCGGNCQANTTPPSGCTSYNQCTSVCSACAAGYTLSSNTCVAATLKLGSSSVSGTNVALGGADSVLFIGGSQVTIGSSTLSQALSVHAGNIFINDAAITSLTPKAAITKEYLDSALSAYGSSNSLWGISGSNIFASTTSWNVGIGTNSPTNKLSVESARGTTVSTSTAAFKVGGSDVYTYMGSLNGGSYTTWIQSLRYSDSAVFPLVLNPNGGNIGIGTTSPGAKLDVWGNLKTDSGSLITDGAGNLTAESFFDKTNVLYKLDPSSSGTALNVVGNMFSTSGVIGTSGTGNNYFMGSLGIGTTGPSSKLYINGGDIKLADTAAAMPFIIKSFAGGTSLWFIGTGGPSIALGEAHDWDRAVEFDYVPGTVGTSAGLLRIGQMNKNNANFTHGITALYTNGTEKMRVNASGNVGIGTTAPENGLSVRGVSSYGLVHIDGSAANSESALSFKSSDDTNSSVGQWLIGKNIGLTGDQFSIWNQGNQRLLIDTAGSVGIGTSIPASKLHVNGGVTVTNGDLTITNGGNSRLTVDKITAGTIDPLYSIKGVKYSTFASAIAGGVKEEVLGKLEITKKINQEYQAVINFDQQKVGSDLWVWRNVVEFNKDSVEAQITPYGSFANVYYYVSGNNLIFRSDKPVEISYRLIAKRFDWSKWPTLANDQTEKASFIIK